MESIELLEKLEQKTILYYLNDINLSKSKKELYDSMFNHLLNGDFDDSFLSKSLEDLDDDSRKAILTLGKNYSFLIFYEGSSSLWLDSIEGVTLQDMDLVCLRLLDNYDFLLKIARVGGEIVLKQLSAFQKSMISKEGSVVEYLRNTFYNDDALIKFLIGISKKEGIYASLNDLEKIKLCISLRNRLSSFVGENEICSSTKFEDKLATILLMREYNGDSLENVSSESYSFISQFLDINYNF